MCSGVPRHYVGVEQQCLDCEAAARWLLDLAPASMARLPLAVVGESAGAHPAALLLQRMARCPAWSERLRGAVLYYGVYDLTGTPSARAARRDTLLLDGPALVPALRQLLVASRSFALSQNRSGADA